MEEEGEDSKEIYKSMETKKKYKLPVYPVKSLMDAG